MGGFDGNYGESWEHDVRDQQLAAEEPWLEHLEHAREQHAERLRRDDPVSSRCDLCGKRGAKRIYGMVCQSCHEARRLEREAA